MASQKTARVESLLLKALLEEHDLGYCGYLSDIEGLYYFVMRSLDEWFSVCEREFTVRLELLAKIVNSLCSCRKEFEHEWNKYRVLFVEHARYLKKATSAKKSINASKS